MTDGTSPPRHEEMLLQTMAYYGGDLSPEETAEFEKHLATCPECQETLKVAKETLPFTEALLAFKPKHTIDEQVARFEAIWAEKRRQEAMAEPSTTPARRRLWFALAIGVAVVAATVFALIARMN